MTSTEARPLLIIGNKNYSSWSLRPWLALRMLGVEFDEHRIPLDTDTFAAEVARYSPAGRVPVLHHDGLRIWDSLAICEYAAERWPAVPAWPQAPAQRALARCVSAEMHAGFEALRDELPMNCRRRIPGFTIPARVEADIARIQAIWTECLESRTGSGPWLFGAFSIADAMYAPVVMRFLTYDVPLSPLLAEYADTLTRSEPMVEWLAAAAAETEVLDGEEVSGP